MLTSSPVGFRVCPTISMDVLVQSAMSFSSCSTASNLPLSFLEHGGTRRRVKAVTSICGPRFLDDTLHHGRNYRAVLMMVDQYAVVFAAGVQEQAAAQVRDLRP